MKKQPKENFTLETIPKVEYCIPLELRDEQIKLACRKISKRVVPSETLLKDPIAVVCFGPSLKKTWPQLKKFKTIITCSGAHKFLISKGIIPTYHLDVDPRPHKVLLMGEPHKDVKYLMASCVHPDVIKHLEGCDVSLWHVFSNDEEARRILPKGEWSMTGGSSAGLRGMTMARFLGYTDMHIFGMDGNIVGSSHAGEHPNAIKKWRELEYDGVVYKTTPSLSYCAKETFHELNQMQDVKAKFYGTGLVQAIAKNYTPEYKTNAIIGFAKPEIISKEYKELNKRLHESNPTYGIGGGRHADTVLKLLDKLITPENKFVSCLDFGCGKSGLARELAKKNIQIAEYDPAISGKEEFPRPADLVVCTDVLEHIEPDKLDFVLCEINDLIRQQGFLVISTRKAGKFLEDGRNAHLIVKNHIWWENKLSEYLTVAKVFDVKAKNECWAVVLPKKNKK